jgi:hypothetical protein
MDNMDIMDGVAGWFRRFFLSDFGAAPQPDVGALPTFQGQKVVQVIYSQSKSRRALVTKDAGNFYRVYVQHWDTSDWSRGYGAYWTGPNKTSTLTDRLEVRRWRRAWKWLLTPWREWGF